MAISRHSNPSLSTSHSCADPRLKIDDLDAAADLRNYCALNLMLDEVRGHLGLI